jgi:hypothetical protein
VLCCVVLCCVVLCCVVLCCVVSCLVLSCLALSHPVVAIAGPNYYTSAKLELSCLILSWPSLDQSTIPLPNEN